MADDFLQQNFPGDVLKLADLYNFGSTYPIDDARDALTSLEFAEQATDIEPADLVGRAGRTMEKLIIAGLYQDAAGIGDRIARRVIDAGVETTLTAYFWQKRARAAARLNDPRAGEFYRNAVDIARTEGRGFEGPEALLSLALDLLDTGYDQSVLRLIGDAPEYGDIRARVLHRKGQHDQAASEYRKFRRFTARGLVTPTEALIAMYVAQARIALAGRNLDAYVAAIGARDDIRSNRAFPVDHPLVYAVNPLTRSMALQEAYYLEAAGNTSEADLLSQLGHLPEWPAIWPDMDVPPTPEKVALFDQETSGFSSSYSPIRPIIDFRDRGNYQGAAAWMRDFSWLARTAENNGSYTDAQVLWQMAFTFVRASDTAIAFDLMDRSARIASTLSFKSAQDDGLQLLERDRWRYLLFVDIAWSAITGQPADDMLVVSRY